MQDDLECDAYGISVVPIEGNQPNSLAAFLAGVKRSALPVIVDVGHDNTV